MPTSGITAWSLTASQICLYAAQELAVVGSGEELDATEQTDCIVRLNAMLKSWQAKGLMFGEATGEITIPADSASGVLPDEIRDVSSARVVISSDNERLMQPWNRGQYLSLPNKAASGSPTIYYVSKGSGTNTMFVWPVPTEETVLKIDYSRVIETVTAGTQTVDIPEDLQETVYKSLAIRIANIFGTARVDPLQLQKLAVEAQQLETQMLDALRPDSYVLEFENNY